MSADLQFNNDCEDEPAPTVVMNKDVIVEYKYAYFHHDTDDVLTNAEDFIEATDLDPIDLCSGKRCLDKF